MSLAELFRRFARPLNQLDIPYMATGAVAAVVYGEPRLTLDVDLVVRISPAEAGRFADAFPAEEFYVPPIEAIEREASRPEHGHFNLLHLTSGLRGDIYLVGSDPLDAWGLKHRRREEVLGEPVWMAPAEYVIVRKLEYYKEGRSTKHLTDIRAMLRIRPDLIEMAVLEAFVAERGLGNEWEGARLP
ncbi:MAG: hypothetical protein HOP28_08425 [Gemmatimonadales bacterium]|nr:hypothetical protein [Gemmatimonadales bacterium]